MKFSKTALFFLFFATSLLVSCGRRSQMTQLSDIESYIDDRPDSALAAIRDINATSLRSKAAKAKYALLHAIALDKNYIDTADISVIAPAIDYYEKKGTADERLKAYYYQGIIHYNGGRYNKAIVSYTRGAESISEAKDLKYHGLLYAGLADCYTNTKEFAEAEGYIDKALECYHEIGHQRFLNGQLFSKAQNLVNLREWDSALRQYKELLDDSSIEEPLKSIIEEYYAITLMTCPSPDEKSAIQHFENVLEETGRLESVNHYAAYAYALSIDGKPTESKEWFGKLERAGFSNDVAFKYWRHRVALAEGNPAEAYELLRESMLQSDSIDRVKYSLSAANAQREYLEQSNREKQLRIKSQRIGTVAICLAALIGMLILGLIIWRIRSLRREESERMSLLIDSLQEQVRDLSREKSQAKFHYLSYLYELITQSGTDGSDYSSKRIYKQIRDKVKSLQNDPTSQKEFENMLNKEFDGIMRKFKADYPSLSDSDYRIASYVFAGFDNTSLMLILGASNSGTVRSMKSRLKSKISSSDVSDKKDYLQFFE